MMLSGRSEKADPLTDGVYCSIFFSVSGTGRNVCDGFGLSFATRKSKTLVGTCGCDGV